MTFAGTGTRGWRVGRFSEAEFTDPQGLHFLDSETLLIADTGNHLIRKLELRGEMVGTVARTGEQARWGALGGPARETALNSPWDLELWDDRVAIAMAGSHQLWPLDLAGGKVGVLAGSGMKNLADGPAQVAALAQPSGFYSDGERLWVVDSETSSLRYLDHSGRIFTVAGTGLFDFGYRDGPAAHALLQHPLGVVATAHGPVVCDTYNSALRHYDIQKGELVTLTHDGLSEPSGAALLGEDLVVADTNNHRLARVGADGEIRPLEIRGLLPPAPNPERESAAAEIGPVELAGEVELSHTLPLPEGQKLDPSLSPPVQLSIYSDDLLPDGGLLLAGDDLPARTQLSLGAT